MNEIIYDGGNVNEWILKKKRRKYYFLLNKTL